MRRGALPAGKKPSPSHDTRLSSPIATSLPRAKRSGLAEFEGRRPSSSRESTRSLAPELPLRARATRRGAKRNRRAKVWARSASERLHRETTAGRNPAAAIYLDQNLCHIDATRGLRQTSGG